MNFHGFGGILLFAVVYGYLRLIASLAKSVVKSLDNFDDKWDFFLWPVFTALKIGPDPIVDPRDVSIGEYIAFLTVAFPFKILWLICAVVLLLCFGIGWIVLFFLWYKLFNGTRRVFSWLLKPFGSRETS